MGLTPHYIQHGDSPAIHGDGPGVLECACGHSVLIAGYEPARVLGIAIQCGACGAVTETPGLPEGVASPATAALVDRGSGRPPPFISAGTALISREEFDRLAALYQPKLAESDTHTISDALLEGVAAQVEQWTGEPLDPAPPSYRDHPLAWAVAHYRARLKDPDWITFRADHDMLAVSVIAAFRELLSTWSHHPQFPAMVATAAARGFSFHGLAMFGAAKALVASGNRVAFVPAKGPRPRIEQLRLVLGPEDQMSVVVRQFDRFEWPNGGQATPQALRAEVIEAMASVQGSINRLRPGMLVLSGGASEGTFDQLLYDSIVAAIGSHGKRHRGLAAVSAVMPKVRLTGMPREARFGYSFYPVTNSAHSVGQSVRIGKRDDIAAA